LLFIVVVLLIGILMHYTDDKQRNSGGYRSLLLYKPGYGRLATRQETEEIRRNNFAVQLV
jgi:hypothetical protein